MNSPRTKIIVGPRRAGAPVLPGPRPYHPGGMAENSPAFQRREIGKRTSSPEGTAETDSLGRPSGTYSSQTSYPALKRRAIVVCPSGTESASLNSNPSGIEDGSLRSNYA